MVVLSLVYLQLEFLRGQPMCLIMIIQSCIDDIKILGISPMAEMKQEGSDFVLFIRRHHSDFAFDLLNTHGRSISTAPFFASDVTPIGGETAPSAASTSSP